MNVYLRFQFALFSNVPIDPLNNLGGRLVRPRHSRYWLVSCWGPCEVHVISPRIPQLDSMAGLHVGLGGLMCVFSLCTTLRPSPMVSAEAWRALEAYR